MTDILAAMQAFMDRFPPQPRRELHCGQAVWDALRELKPADTGPIGFGAALGGMPLYGIPVHVDQTMRAGWWELRENGEVARFGDITIGLAASLPEAARKRHRAKAQLCLSCEPDVERSARCSACRRRVVVVGETVQPHPVRFSGAVIRCIGSGDRVPLPAPVDRPIFVALMSGGLRRAIALPSLPAGPA